MAFTLIITVSTPVSEERRMVPRLPADVPRDWSKCSTRAAVPGPCPGALCVLGAVVEGAGLSSCSRESSSCYLELSRGARGVGRGPTVGEWVTVPARRSLQL